MVQLKDTSHQKEAWNLMAVIRNSGLMSQDVALSLSGIIFIRWLDIEARIDTDLKHIIPDSYRWDSWQQLPASEVRTIVSEKIPACFAEYVKTNNNILNSYINELSRDLKVFSRFSDELVEALIEWIGPKQFNVKSGPYSLSTSYEELLEFLSSEHLSGINKIPTSIARLVIDMVAPSHKDRIYDPCAGIGDLLVETSNYFQETFSKNKNASFSSQSEIYGTEKNHESYVIAVTRLIVSNGNIPNMKLIDALHKVGDIEADFDFVLTIPPLGTRTKLDSYKNYPVKTEDTIGLYIQHSLSKLRQGGKAVFVVPGGFLFSGGSVFEVRKYLVEHHNVEVVLSLPNHVFQNTSIGGYVLIIKKGGTTRNIRMVNGKPYFEKATSKKQVQIRKDLARQLIEKTWAKQVSKDVWDMPISELSKLKLDFTPRKRDTSKLKKQLSFIGNDIEFIKLGECCTIYSGHAVKKEYLAESPGQEEAIPYIRIKDIQNGKAKTGSLWLVEEDKQRIQSKYRLKQGAVLFSKSGTIGKVGLVEGKSVGAIASSGFFVIQCDKNKLESKFLLAYLNSNEVRLWFKDRATGSTISHLQLQDLNELEVPLPSLEIQGRLAYEYDEFNADVISSLAMRHSGVGFNPHSKQINILIDFMGEEGASISSPLNFTALTFVAKEISKIRDVIVHKNSADNKFTSWIVLLNETTKRLHTINSVPKGLGLFSLLKDIHSELFLSLETATSTIPVDSQLRSLTERITYHLQAAIDALLSDTKIYVTSDIDTMMAGEVINLTLNVKNKSVLPIRNISIRTSPDWGENEIEYIPENGEVKFYCMGQAPNIKMAFNIIINWMGERIDGKAVKGEHQIVINIVESTKLDSKVVSEFGGSPYVCGDPVRPDREDVFFGREELLDQIHRYIIKSGNVVLLEGNRRTGKTSILSHLEGSDTIKGWLGVYCSLQGAEGSKDGVGVSTVEIFREIAKAIIKSVSKLNIDVPLPNGEELKIGKKLGIAKSCREGISDDSPFSDCREFIESILELLKTQKLNLLLMLDEFDKIQEGIDNGVTSPQVPENIRFLVQTYPNFSAILTGSRRLKRLREEYWSALFGLGTRVGVSALRRNDAVKLITQPVKDQLTYSDNAIEKTYFLTAGQPYLLQCLCNRIFDLSAQEKIRSVTIDVVERASDLLVEDNEHFASLWGYAGSDRCRFVLALCQHEDASSNLLHLGVIQELLSKYGIDVNDEKVISDLEHLRELEMLGFQEDTIGGHYSLNIPLMGTWIDKQQDFAALASMARYETEDQNG